MPPLFHLLQEAFRAFHNDKDLVRKYLKAIHVGAVEDEDKDAEVKKDFEDLRKTAQKMVCTSAIWT